MKGQKRGRSQKPLEILIWPRIAAKAHTSYALTKTKQSQALSIGFLKHTTNLSLKVKK
ncbi:hypothetical protein QG37_07992 [Candidozyma auris]|uniref:Uncharacterized protein n=1 Tax=Candidozyma auris TaxID=498019 RepID=A0A0L0NNS6_CANAR|nr:hypothetical protein QG37_07992 [[Candida] auris]